MPECTEAERQLLDALIAGGRTDALLKTVRDQRVTPELRERVVQAQADISRAINARDAVLEEVTAATGLVGEPLIPFLEGMQREAAELVAAEVAALDVAVFGQPLPRDDRSAGPEL